MFDRSPSSIQERSNGLTILFYLLCKTYFVFLNLTLHLLQASYNHIYTNIIKLNTLFVCLNVLSKLRNYWSRLKIYFCWIVHLSSKTAIYNVIMLWLRSGEMLQKRENLLKNVAWYSKQHKQLYRYTISTHSS